MKTKLAGWKKICVFAYVQSVKSKAMKITMAILCTICILSMPVSSLISGIGSDSDDTEKTTAIEKVYVYDNTSVIGEQFAGKNIKSELYDGIVYEKTENNGTEYIDGLINRADNENEIFLSIEYCDDPEDMNYGINVYTYYREDSGVSKEDASDFAAFIDENTKKAVLLGTGESLENVLNVMKNIEYNVVSLDKDGNAIDSDESISMFQYYFTFTFIIIGIFIVSLTGSKVSELIVTEKSTRVMEYILTSVKPMAVLVGKVIGSTLIMLTMFAGMALSFVASLFINNAMFPSDDGSFVLPEALRQLMDKGALTGVTPLNILIIVILFTLGVMFYGCVAGIAGATVSKIEEMAEGIKLFTFAMMIGAYLPMFMAISNFTGETDWGAFSYAVYLIPLSSMFILPQYLLLGRVSAGLTLGAAGILIISIILVMMLVNRIYEHMLYSNGATLSVKDIIGLAKKGKAEHNGK